jgi:hypothetical protein
MANKKEKPVLIPVFVISKWQENFENAKSRTVEQKSYGQYPLKQGLGYCHLMLQKDGVSIFGAFMALANIIHSKPAKKRQGYLTTTGDNTGYPLSFNDMAMLTRMPKKTIESAIRALISQPVGWILKDTMKIPDGYRADTAIISEYEHIVCTVCTVSTVKDSSGTGLESGKAAVFSPASLDLPYNSPEFKDAWEGLMEIRRKKKAPQTERALKGILRKLSKLARDEEQAITLLDNAIQSGWRTVFPENKFTNKQDSYKSEAEIEREKAEQQRRGEEALQRLTREGFVPPELRKI